MVKLVADTILLEVQARLLVLHQVAVRVGVVEVLAIAQCVTAVADIIIMLELM